MWPGLTNMSFFKTHRERIIRLLLWMLVLLPIIGSIVITMSRAVDQRFLDDWELVKYLVNFKEGTLHWRDLFAVYIEHRPAVSRLLSIAAILLGGGDMRGQNLLTLLMLLTGFATLARIWIKYGGATIREVWFPLLICSTVLFTPVQWQTLLWADCFYSVIPSVLLVISIGVAFQSWPWWVRCALGTFLAIVGTLSFASGVLLWLLPLPVMLVCGAFRNRSQKIKFTVLWVAVMTLVFSLYLNVRVQARDTITVEQPLISLPGGYVVTYDLRNEVPRQFAYHQENENTTATHTPYFLAHPQEVFDFVRAFCGVLLVRGFAADTKTAAIWTGTLVLAGFCALIYFCWRYRREPDLFRLLIALLCLGAYTPITGILVAVGRLWAGHVYSALNVRYHAHHPQIIIALVGAAFFILRQRAKERSVESGGGDKAFCWTSGGVLMGFLVMGWLYGINMMDAWRSARLRNAAAQMACLILPERNRFVANVSGDANLTRHSVNDLVRNGLLKNPPLQDTRLFSVLTMHKHAIGQEHAFINRLWKENGRWFCEGYASLPVSQRPADGVFFAYRLPEGEWTIWGFTQGDAPPHYLPSAMGKDLWGIVGKNRFWPHELMCAWERNPAIIADPPAGAEISLWAIEMDTRSVYRITNDPIKSPDASGDSLEFLAVHHDPQPPKSLKD